jgi:hypothetical protein
LGKYIKSTIGKLLIVITILFFPGISSAEWVEVKTANPEVKFLFESDTIQQFTLQPTNYKVKIKHTFSPEFAKKQQDVWSKVATMESTNEFSINESIARLLSFAAFDENGEWVTGDTRGDKWKKYNNQSPYGVIEKYIRENKETIDTRPKY